MADKKINWARIKRDFEQTDAPVLVIAGEHGVSRAAIDKRSKKENWTINDARVELKARRAGGSNVGEIVERHSEPVSGAIPAGKMLTEPDYARARLIFEGGSKVATFEFVAGEIGVTVFDIEQRMEADKLAGNPWIKNRAARVAADAPQTAAEFREGKMVPAAPPTEPVIPPPGVDTSPPPTAVEIRRSIRAITHRDADRDLRAAKRLKPEQLVTIARDVLDRLICQIDDIIGNRDVIVELLEEARDADAITPKRYAILEHAFDIVKLSGAARQVASAAKLLVEQSEARSGKKERQKEDAAGLAESGKFRKRGAAPRLVADAGKPV